MSFGDPNNPYGQPPQQPPQPPLPQQPPTVPGYNYDYGYGYPQQQTYPGYAGYPGQPGYPGAGMMPPQSMPSMPGLLTTARVFLFIIGGVQILGGLAWLYIAAFVSDVTDGATSGSASLESFDDAGHAAAGMLVFIALLTLGIAALSITLGVKFSRGGQGIRITTVVYGALGSVVGLIALFAGLDTGSATAVVFPLIWVVFAGVITAAPVVPSGTAWFARPRY